ncbi:NAD-dependent epimerase/dehydratase family protein [Qipengyuania sp.]|uniref:NAD-dependent epimerase/dehydratase family protein n=1 Tax=Qipengyuania sp. TaxID=2004515 RepID=UPI0035C83C7D
MTVAITGATGFVGQAVLDEAARRELTVRALTRRAQEDRFGVTWIEGTLGDDAALARLAEGAEAVVHIAGLTSAPDPAAFGPANVDGTAAMLRAAKDSGSRLFVFVSSLAAREPGLSAYGASKAQAERLVETSGLDWTIVRPPGVYGPRDVDYLEMFRTAKRGFVPLPPPGASSIIHVADLARLLLDVCGAPRNLVRRGLFEPDDGRAGGWSHKALANAIGAAVGKDRVFAPHLPKTIMRVAAQADGMIRGNKARLTLDRVGYMAHPDWVARPPLAVPGEVWRPQIQGREGLVETARWYRENGWL